MINWKFTMFMNESNKNSRCSRMNMINSKNIYKNSKSFFMKISCLINTIHSITLLFISKNIFLFRSIVSSNIFEHLINQTFVVTIRFFEKTPQRNKYLSWNKKLLENVSAKRVIRINSRSHDFFLLMTCYMKSWQSYDVILLRAS